MAACIAAVLAHRCTGTRSVWLASFQGSVTESVNSLYGKSCCKNTEILQAKDARDQVVKYAFVPLVKQIV